MAAVVLAVPTKIKTENKPEKITRKIVIQRGGLQLLHCCFHENKLLQKWNMAFLDQTHERNNLRRAPAEVRYRRCSGDWVPPQNTQHNVIRSSTRGRRREVRWGEVECCMKCCTVVRRYRFVFICKPLKSLNRFDTTCTTYIMSTLYRDTLLKIRYDSSIRY